MAARKKAPLALGEWKATGVTELRKVWEDLRPDSADESVERKFAGESLTLDQAGAVFERWVLEAFRLSGWTGHYAFRVPLGESGSTREQIDGLLLDGWQGFLVESKFWTNKVDFGPIALLHALVDLRPVGTLGLFFSAFGYTAPAVESARLLRPLRVLLFDKDDLGDALAEGKTFKGRMAEIVRRKWALAVQTGRPHVSVLTPIELFNY
jgi:hypothetical protein